MDETATVALVAVAAVALFFLVKRSEAETAMLIAQINARKQQKSSEPYALGLSDVIAIGGTAAATYFGGPAAGAKAAAALAPQ